MMHSERLLLGDLGDEAQGREPDPEAIRDRAVAEPEDGRERVTVWLRQPLQALPAAGSRAGAAR